MDNPSYKIVGNFYFDPNEEPLGSGSYGTVYKGYEKQGKKIEPVAIKVISKESIASHNGATWLYQREADILLAIKGKYILELKAVIKHEDENLYIITNFCNGGSLWDRYMMGVPLPENEALRILKEVVHAFIDVKNLKIENEQGEQIIIMHRDLKPENILFHNGVTQIGDFGMAKFIEFKKRYQKEKYTCVGTQNYMSPQVLSREPYSSKCDVWSMGIMLYEMVVGASPYKECKSNHELIEEIKKKPLRFPPNVSLGCKNLILDMLQFNEDPRPGWSAIYDRAIIKQINLDDNIPKVNLKNSKLEIIQEIKTPVGSTNQKGQQQQQKLQEEENKKNSINDQKDDYIDYNQKNYPYPVESFRKDLYQNNVPNQNFVYPWGKQNGIDKIDNTFSSLKDAKNHNQVYQIYQKKQTQDIYNRGSNINIRYAVGVTYEDDPEYVQKGNMYSPLDDDD